MFCGPADDRLVFAQAQYNVLPESDFRIAGRSNESDFEVHSTEISGFLELTDSGDPLSVSGLSLTVPSEGIKSDKGIIMNRVMYDGLNIDEYPNITFEMISASVPEVLTDSLNLVIKGSLTLTGTTTEIEIEMFADTDESGRSQYVGSFPLTMTDYGMKPPTAMFGSLRVHKDIRIHFDLVFESDKDG